MTENIYKHKILILDFGSQYTQLIARRVRENQVYCEIHPFNLSIEKIRKFSPRAIILSGGPSSIYDEDSPFADREILGLDVPILGICYGMQYLTHVMGGAVEKAVDREYGNATITIIDDADLFHGFDRSSEETVWMSHGDRIDRVPEGFRTIANSRNSPVAAMVNSDRRFYGVQFHPEVAHTPNGSRMLKNFLFRICGCEPSWTMASFAKQTIIDLRERLGNDHVVCGLSGGVDSSVTAVLLNEAIGDRLSCIFVDNGLLRKGESQEVMELFRDHYRMNTYLVDASSLFLDKLRGVTDPEKKRKIIGHEFISVFEKKAIDLGKVKSPGTGDIIP